MSARPSGFVPLKLRPGDVVEVRSEAEILATLDERGAIDGLPFMPEMLAYCGKRLRVELRADKTCDTINYAGARRMYDTVHLAGTRCDGQAHGGCHAGCLFFWKEAWLKRVGEDGTAQADKPAARCDRAHLEAMTRQPPAPGETEMRYRCQATDLLIASEPMRWWDPRQYVRDVWSGNITVMQVVRAVLFRGFRRLLRIGGYRALLSSYSSEAEIDLARKRSLQTIDNVLQSTLAYSEQLTKRKVELEAKKEELKGKPIVAVFDRELESIDSELARQADLIAQKKRETEMVVAKYDADKQRWRELVAAKAAENDKSGVASDAAPPPAAGKK